MTLKVTSNYKPRRLMAWVEIPPKERPELDFGVDPHEPMQYFEAYGRWHKLDDFTRIHKGPGTIPAFSHYVPEDSPLAKWDYIATESAFTGIVIKCGDDDEWVVAGWAQDLS